MGTWKNISVIASKEMSFILRVKDENKRIKAEGRLSLNKVIPGTSWEVNENEETLLLKMTSENMVSFKEIEKLFDQMMK